MWVKKIITIFILSTTIVFSQDKYEILENLNDDLTLLIYEEVVNVDGVPKDILFERIERYIVNGYVSSNQVVQLNDKEKGNIIVKGTGITRTDGFFSINIYVPHTLDIKVKDGRYKYILKSSTIETISDQKNTFTINDLLTSKRYTKKYGYNKWVSLSDIFLKSIVIEMKEYIFNDTITEEEDW